MPNRQSLGPVVLEDGCLIPEPSRPGSHLSQSLLLDALLSLAPAIHGDVLDVGCGKKPYSSIFMAHARSYIGCDWPPGDPNHADHRADVFADAMMLPFASASFDSVVCTEVLEHLPSPALCVAEMARVLRPEGTLLVSVPFFYWLHEFPRDYYRYTEFGLRHILHEAGFEIAELRSRGGLFAVFLDLQSKWVTQFTKRVARRVPGGELLIAASSWLVRGTGAAYLGMRRQTRRAGQESAASMGGLATLGYVAVAKKRRC